MEVIKSAIIKDKAKSALASRYAIPNSVLEEVDSIYSDHMKLVEEDLVVETRKALATASRVVDLIKILKPRKKGSIDKGKKVKTWSTTLEGQPLTSSL